MFTASSLKPYRMHLLLIVSFAALAALVELLMGRVLICKSGQVLFWYGNIYGSGNSQHLTDWYTFSHIIHGMAFYGLLWLAARRLPVRNRLVLAIAIECAWEIAENSPFIINRYRAVTSAFDYIGDSVINSISDICAAGFGFFLAYALKTWRVIVLIVLLEMFTLYKVRDNLTLNVAMLVHPIDSIRKWQLDADFVPDSLKR